MPFLLAGGVYSLAWALAVRPDESSHATIGITLALVLLASGAITWWQRDRLPQILMSLCGPGGAVLVVAANIATDDTTAGSQLFLLCPIVYCASFLSARLAVISVVLATAGTAVLMMSALPAAEAATSILGVGVALAVTVAVICAWRRRADEALAQLNVLAVEDPLTGLANRRAFDSEFAHAALHAERAGTTLSLLVVDIDHFKTINDTRGHQTGDRVLVEAASILRQAVRRADIVARIGGDEFALILFACPAEEARRIAAEVVERFRARRGDDLQVTVSCGVATAPPVAASPAALLSAADEALYRAKRDGRDGVAVALGPIRGTPPGGSEVSASPAGGI